ncbi:MAG: hypothetical protein J2P53_18630 [Bradyrhizobiaceae bacterium]|nr:hypothetical protein [Bradyrhizobiaceae bacterium]
MAEQAAIHVRDANGFYAVDRSRRGEDILMAIESGEIGEVAGCHLLHLQCHIGLDTLCLARRGAIVTGLDFSDAAVAAAQRLAAEAGLKALFMGLAQLAARRRAMGWHRVGPPGAGGFLYLLEQHPFLSIMKWRMGLVPSGTPIKLT